MNRCYAEHLIITKFLKRGWEVYTPAHDGCVTDLIVSYQCALIKIQVKTANPRKNDSIRFGLEKCRPDGSKHRYTKAEADYFFLVNIVTDEILVVPNNEDRAGITISESTQCNANSSADYSLQRFFENMEQQGIYSRPPRKQKEKQPTVVHSTSGFKGVIYFEDKGKYAARLYNRKRKISKYIKWGDDPKELALEYDRYVENNYPGIFKTNKQLGLL